MPPADFLVDANENNYHTRIHLRRNLVRDWNWSLEGVKQLEKCKCSFLASSKKLILTFVLLLTMLNLHNLFLRSEDG